MKKAMLFIAAIIAVLLVAGCNKDLSGEAYGKMTKEAVAKVCKEQPEICPCLKEQKNFDLCICLKQAGPDYLMQDNCWSEFMGKERPQGEK